MMRADAERNYGIDLLRMLSMLLVVVLHVLGQGGILNKEPLTANDNMAWFLESLAFCAVNCYALITGYVCYGRPQRYSRLFFLWMQVFFYGVLITAAFAVFSPGTVGPREVINSLLTVKLYWYFTAYAILFVFIPYINRLIGLLSADAFLVLVLLIVLVMSIVPAVTGDQGFFNQDGYGPVWLASLYIIGAFIKIRNMPSMMSGTMALSGYFLCSMLAWSSRIVIAAVSGPMDISQAKANILLSYTSPLILGAAVFLLLFCVRLRLKGAIASAVLFLAPLSFGVYLIHTHPLVFEYLLKGAFSSFLDDPWFVMMGKVVAVSLGIYLGSTLVDLIRSHLFRWAHLKRLSESVESCVTGPAGRRVLDAVKRALRQDAKN